MKTKELTLTGVLCAVLCAVSPFAVPLPFSPVPVTLATFLLYLTAFLLPTKQAFFCCLVYLLMGMAGLPVFAGFAGGFGKLAGPTGGYLVGYLFLVSVSAGLLKRLAAGFWSRCLALAAGTAVCYLFGTAWLCLQMRVSPLEGFLVAVLPYLPLDCGKIAAAALLGPKITGALKRAQ